MKKNFNKSGRFIRYIIGSVLLLLSIFDFFEDDFLDNLSLGIGLYLVITGILVFCPLYYFLGIDTSKSNDKMKMY